MAYSDFEKAEAFKDTLEVTFQENVEPYCDDKIEEVENVVCNYFDNFTTLTPPLTSPIEVRGIIKRLQNLRVDRTLSSPRPIRSGLPQGSLSSPLLFTLYVNDIPQTDLSHLAMFADDTAIITQNKRFSVVISNLQHYISLLELWLTDWKVKVNASKSACLMFTRRPRLPVGLTPVQIFGQPVPWGQVLRNLHATCLARTTNDTGESGREQELKKAMEWNGNGTEQVVWIIVHECIEDLSKKVLEAGYGGFKG
ncbi:RNA-directed DNA polymerase from mobile element jockey [Trichonephila clavipes]|nr:RNA-directed DNA polymerase from mobile element jockey [Trichonephila clavipes]